MAKIKSIHDATLDAAEARFAEGVARGLWKPLQPAKYVSTDDAMKAIAAAMCRCNEANGVYEEKP